MAAAGAEAGGERLRRAALVALALALCACPFAGVTQLNRLPESEPLPEPELVNRPGPLRHEPTGFEFPERYADFERVTAYRYDSAGLDFSVGYNDPRPDCVVAATLYVYPAPRMSFVGASPQLVASMEERWLASEFARSKAEIERAHPQLQSPLVAVVHTPLLGDRVPSPSFRFREAGSLSELRLQLYDRQWFLKSRFTYPESCRSDAEDRIDALMRELPWAVQPRSS